jgi:hypothetical protein
MICLIPAPEPDNSLSAIAKPYDYQVGLYMIVLQDIHTNFFSHNSDNFDPNIFTGLVSDHIFYAKRSRRHLAHF